VEGGRKVEGGREGGTAARSTIAIAPSTVAAAAALAVALSHFMICHSKSAINTAPQDVIKTTRWNKGSSNHHI
jgi:hypothetical protein